MAEPMDSLPTLNCAFLISSANSMPLIVIAAESLKPKHGPDPLLHGDDPVPQHC
jgi:hypothetical protein